MKPLALLLFLVFATGASAQTIVMKDGKTVAAKALRRQGDQIIATVEVPGAEGQPARTGDLGYPLAQIQKIDFPEPPILKGMAELMIQGKTAEGLAQLEPVLKYYEGFRDAPGSWWGDAALLKVQALAALGRNDEADPVARQLLSTAGDPETIRAAEVQLAMSQVRGSKFDKALETCKKALEESKRPQTRALASIGLGQCLLAKKEWEPAMIAFLEVPVFYPTERILLPQAELGAGRAQEGMDDLPRAKARLEEMLKTYGSAPEASLAKGELDKIARREKALAAPQ